MTVCDSENYIHWIKDIFDDCISTPMEITSFSFGLFADVIRIVCAIPQLVDNYKSKDVSGISPFLFALIWLGSCLTMFGVFINHGSFTQILTGIIDLFFDSILYFQFFYYRYIYRKCSRKSKMNQFFNSIDSNVDKKDPARFSETTPSNSALLMNVLMMGGSAFNWAEPYQGKQIAGTVFGWVGSCIYIGSRIPQVIQNFKQKQVKDLSLAFVILMCVSNLSYILSVLFKSNNLVYLWMQVP